MKNPNEEFKVSEEFLKELSIYLDYTGLNNPFIKVYLTTKSMNEHPVIVFLFVITHLNKLFLFNKSGQNKRNSDLVDGTPFVAGVHTILKQLHSNVNEKFIELLSQFILNSTKSSLG